MNTTSYHSDGDGDIDLVGRHRGEGAAAQAGPVPVKQHGGELDWAEPNGVEGDEWRRGR
jgi:hypothetical protein